MRSLNRCSSTIHPPPTESGPRPRNSLTIRPCKHGGARPDSKRHATKGGTKRPFRKLKLYNLTLSRIPPETVKTVAETVHSLILRCAPPLIVCAASDPSLASCAGDREWLRKTDRPRFDGQANGQSGKTRRFDANEIIVGHHGRPADLPAEARVLAALVATPPETLKQDLRPAVKNRSSAELSQDESEP